MGIPLRFDDIVDGFTGIVKDVFNGLDDINLLDGFNSVLNKLDDSNLLNNFVGDTLLKGGLADDVIRLAVGTAIGGGAGGIVLGLLGNDDLIGAIADDLLNGGKGDDRLRGLGGNDLLTGLLGSDRLEGGRGDDTLVGGKGLDNLFGGGGRDNFVLEKRSGMDVIHDFKDGLDYIKLLDGIDYEDLKIVQNGVNTLISAGRNQLATLNNTNADRITASDFIVDVI
jgi:5'-nucleotidase / UDP-sugar diphosphatase